MKALYFDGELKLRTDVAPPRAGEGEALVRVLRAGICDTDLAIMHGKHPRATAPLIMGHEISGWVRLRPLCASRSGTWCVPAS